MTRLIVVKTDEIKAYNEEHRKQNPCFRCGWLMRDIVCADSDNRALCSKWCEWVEEFIWPEGQEEEELEEA